MTQPIGYVLTQDLPDIPAKRYFTIGEVSTLCGVRSYVLRYWEQEFAQLRPMKRRGNRRYYQHHEVLLVRKIRELLYEQGYTIQGARQQLELKVVTVAADESIELLMNNEPDLDADVQDDDGSSNDSSWPEESSAESVSPAHQHLTDPAEQMIPVHGLAVLIADLRIVRDLLNPR